MKELMPSSCITNDNDRAHDVKCLIIKNAVASGTATRAKYAALIVKIKYINFMSISLESIDKEAQQHNHYHSIIHYTYFLRIS